MCYPLFSEKIVKPYHFSPDKLNYTNVEYNRIGTILFNILVLWTGLEPVIKVYKTLVITTLTTWGWWVELFNDVAHQPSTYISTKITMTFSIHWVITSSLRTLLLTYSGVKGTNCLLSLFTMFYNKYFYYHLFMLLIYSIFKWLSSIFLIII